MTRKHRKKDENPLGSAMEANLEQASSKLAVAASSAPAPHIVALPAPEEAIELVRAAMKADATQKLTNFDETGNFPLLESSVKCANPRVYAAMKLKSGKILPSSPATTLKKLTLPVESTEMVETPLATLSELFMSDQIAKPRVFDEMSLNNALPGSSCSSLRVESVGLPENLDISFAFQSSGDVGEPRLAENVSENEGLTTSCGSHLGVEQVTLGGKNLVSSATMLKSGGTAKVTSPEVPSAGVGAVGALAPETNGLDTDAFANTCGRACPVEQGTPREVDPAATEVNLGARAGSPVKDAPLGQNADKVIDGVASWVEMVRKNRMNTEEVVKLVDCVEGITEDSVFLEDEDLSDDSLERLCLIGIFPSKFPGRDAVQRIVNSWPRKCRFNYHSSGWIVFVFESEADMSEVMNAGPYYAFGKPLLLKRMPPLFDFSKEACTSVPVWIQLPNLPLRLWKDKPLSKICSFLGSPQYTDKMTATKKVLSFARCLVEVDMKMKLPNAIPITFPDGKILMQPVLYEDLPKFCSKCCKLGHNDAGHDIAKDDAPALYVVRNRRPEAKRTVSKKKKVVVEEPDVPIHNSGKTRPVQTENPRSGFGAQADEAATGVDGDEDGLDDVEDAQRMDLNAGISGVGLSGGQTRHVQNLSPDANPRTGSGIRAQSELDGLTRGKTGLVIAEKGAMDSGKSGGQAPGIPVTESRHAPKTCPETCPRACPGSETCPDLGTCPDTDAIDSDTPLANSFSVLSPIQGRNWADEVEIEEEEDTPAPSKSKGKKQKKSSRASSDVGKSARSYVLRGASPLRRQG